MDDVNQALANLKHPDEAVREEATQQLWQSWFYQKGSLGLARLKRSQAALDAGKLAEAERHLTDLIADQPDFTEAWNRRAVLYYMQQNYRKAIADCQQVVAQVPFHFGALHGLGLCYAALGEYREAIAAFRRALDIQPYAVVNQRLILECTARLS
ncbi:MAG: tetratricopeptide repeat protein [Cyanobacteria bacterium P01_A01_bin.135]